VAVLPPSARIAAAALRAFARGSLLWMAATIALGDGPLQSNTLAQIRSFAALFLVPEVAAWCVLRAFRQAGIEQGRLVLARGRHRLELALGDIAAVEPWRLPLPGPGAWLRLASGARWPHGIAIADPEALARLLLPATGEAMASRAQGDAGLPGHRHGRLDRLLAVRAAAAHWRSRRSGCTSTSPTAARSASSTASGCCPSSRACAGGPPGRRRGAVRRGATRGDQAGTLAAVLLRPALTIEVRRWLERLGLAARYMGLPAWLLVRMADN
jgi:apolipoprotein N-acyltransferase